MEVLHLQGQIDGGWGNGEEPGVLVKAGGHPKGKCDPELQSPEQLCGQGDLRKITVSEAQSQATSWGIFKATESKFPWQQGLATEPRCRPVSAQRPLTMGSSFLPRARTPIASPLLNMLLRCSRVV